MASRPVKRLSHDQIRLPPRAMISMAQFADGLRSRGFSVETLTEDYLQAQSPPTTALDLPLIDRWFPRARLLVRRSDAGFTISHRLPIRRLLATNLFSALVLAVAVPGSLVSRSLLVLAMAVLTGVLQSRSVQRQRTLLTFGESDQDTSIVS